jgi:hypothetical protein
MHGHAPSGASERAQRVSLARGVRFNGAQGEKAVWGARVALMGVLACAMLATSCGDLTRQGQAASYLVITNLQGASGAESGTLANVVKSDVITVVNGSPTYFSDPGSATFQLALKDPGGATSPNSPTPNNFITITQYHVEYVRSDGRNQQGVDVPFAFDGAVTTTVSDTASVGFTLVRNQAKLEAPLKALQTNPIVITAIAKVTFYGHDQTGREVSVTGNIEVSFANFGDPS